MKRALQIGLVVVGAVLSIATSRVPPPRTVTVVAVEPAARVPSFAEPPDVVRYISVPTADGRVIVIRCDSPGAPAGCWQ